MMKIQCTNPKVHEKDVQLLEQNSNLKLPGDYRKFLLAFNGGIPEKLKFSAKKYGDSILKELYGIYDNEPVRDIQSNLKTYILRIPNEFISIGCDQLGNQIILGMRGKYKNKIYFWWHEGESETEKITYSNIYFVSENFTSFLGSLGNIPDNPKGNFEDYFRNEDYDEIKKLIDAGWNVNTPFENKLTPVQFITLRNNLDILKLLIDKKADLHGCIDHAITNNHYEILEFLLKSGADPDEMNNVGRTPLHQAVIKGSYRATELLIAWNADPDIKDSYDHSLMDLALKVKVRGGKPEIDKIIDLIKQ